jgi:hypothetical protein
MDLDQTFSTRQKSSAHVKTASQKHKKTNGKNRKHLSKNVWKLLAFAFASKYANLYNTPVPRSPEQLVANPNTRRTRSLVREVLGTQEPVMILRSGITALTTSGAGNVLTTINCDISGAQHWGSWTTVFDEYKLLHATLHIVPWLEPVNTTFATTPATNIPILVAVDYDDNTPPTAVSDLLAYDSQKVYFLGSHNPKVYTIKAQLQGIPDHSWYPTASPIIPAWFKIATFVGTPFLTLAVADVYIEFEVRFRQTV